ncbi:MAG TPA: RHS repeat-associated core domain-containing protein [Clostridia bacterium]
MLGANKYTVEVILLRNFDKETGTIYLRARYYNPAVGRFITEDSYLGKDNDPLSLNLYTYCENDPINSIDPSGHENIPGDVPTQYRNLVDGTSTNIMYSKTQHSKPLNDWWLQGKTPEELNEMYRKETDPAKRKKIKEQQKYVGERNKQTREDRKKSKADTVQPQKAPVVVTPAPNTNQSSSTVGQTSGVSANDVGKAVAGTAAVVIIWKISKGIIGGIIAGPPGAIVGLAS